MTPVLKWDHVLKTRSQNLVPRSACCFCGQHTQTEKECVWEREIASVQGGICVLEKAHNYERDRHTHLQALIWCLVFDLFRRVLESWSLMQPGTQSWPKVMPSPETTRWCTQWWLALTLWQGHRVVVCGICKVRLLHVGLVTLLQVTSLSNAAFYPKLGVIFSQFDHVWSAFYPKCGFIFSGFSEHVSIFYPKHLVMFCVKNENPDFVYYIN